MVTGPPRILLTRRWPADVEKVIAERWDLTVDASDRALTSDELRVAMGDYDILCPTVSDKIDRSILSVSGRRVGLVANYGAGFEHIDLAAAAEAGIIVTNTPDVLTQASAELTITLMLMTSRRASEGEREVRTGHWAGWRPTHMLGHGLIGRRLHLIGFGRIGQATAAIARAAFGMEIAYYSPRRVSREVEQRYGARYYPDLNELVANADILSLHCRGGRETHHLVDAELLGRMKPDAILVNTARGSIVDEVALTAALASGQIAAAGLDVYENEPEVSSTLIALPNAVLLPHLGSATVEARTAMGMRVISNIAAFLEGAAPPDRI